MPRREPRLLIEDMLAAMRKIDRYTSEMDQDMFRKDEKTVDAVVRNLEVLGEAARHLPENFVARHPDVPWRQVTGLRNRIVHDYFGLDLDIVWQAIRHDLPRLKARLEKVE